MCEAVDKFLSLVSMCTCYIHKRYLNKARYMSFKSMIQRNKPTTWTRWCGHCGSGHEMCSDPVHNAKRLLEGVLCLGAASKEEVDVDEVVRTLRAAGVHPPLLLRFPDIVAHRLNKLQVVSFERNTLHKYTVVMHEHCNSMMLCNFIFICIFHCQFSFHFVCQNKATTDTDLLPLALQAPWCDPYSG